MGMGAWLKAKMSLDSSGVSVGAQKADKSVTALFSKIRRGGKAAFLGLTKVALAAFGGIATGAGALAYTVKKSFNFETSKVQLKALLGSMGAAKDRFKELKDFSASTPFQLPEILQASRLLTVFSEGVLGSAKSLRSIGDAAAVAGQGIDEVAFWVGRAYSMLKSGKPFGEAAMRLQEMGILTASGRNEIEAMVAAGQPLEKTFGRLQQELGRFSGGMKDLSTTGNGLISTLKDNWTIAVATFGEEFKNLAKGGLQAAIDKIQQLVKDGTIQQWASQAKEALAAVVETVSLLSKGGEKRTEVLQALGGVIKAAFNDAANVAVQILLKAVPQIGYSLGKAALDIIKGASRDALTEDQSATIQAEQKQFRKEEGLSIFSPRLSARYKTRKEEMETENREKRLAEEGIKLSEAVSEAGRELPRALEEMGALLKKGGNSVVGEWERGGKKLSDSLNDSGGRLEQKIMDAADSIAVAGDEFADTVKVAAEDAAGKNEKKNLGTFYSGGMGKEIEAAKGFFDVGTGDLSKQLDFWKSKLAGTRNKKAGNFDSLGWNSGFHTDRAAERDQFNQAAMADVIKRIEGLIELQSQPQKELTALEKETVTQTAILRQIRNAQEIANL